MRKHIGESLNIWRKLLLTTAGILAFATPIFIGMLHVTEIPTAAAGRASAIYRAPIPNAPEVRSKQEFEFASVKQNMSDVDANMSVDENHANGGSFSGPNGRMAAYIY